MYSKELSKSIHRKKKNVTTEDREQGWHLTLESEDRISKCELYP